MMAHLPYLLALWLLMFGLFGIVRSRDLVHTILCLGVVQASTYVLLLAIGVRHAGVAPIFSPRVPLGTVAVDPVMHALTLTDIVVGAAVDALLLVITIQINRERHTIDPEHLRPMRG